MNDYLQIFTTVEHKDDAEKIAGYLLENRLAACVQIVGPLTSHFWWDNKIDKAEEYLCIIKSRADLYVKLEELITKNHPYTVPEIVAVPIVASGRDYLAWLEKELPARKSLV